MAVAFLALWLGSPESALPAGGSTTVMRISAVPSFPLLVTSTLHPSLLLATRILRRSRHPFDTKCSRACETCVQAWAQSQSQSCAAQKERAHRLAGPVTRRCNCSLQTTRQALLTAWRCICVCSRLLDVITAFCKARYLMPPHSHSDSLGAACLCAGLTSRHATSAWPHFNRLMLDLCRQFTQ